MLHCDHSYLKIIYKIAYVYLFVSFQMILSTVSCLHQSQNKKNKQEYDKLITDRESLNLSSDCYTTHDN